LSYKCSSALENLQQGIGIIRMEEGLIASGSNTKAQLAKPNTKRLYAYSKEHMF
jgi:hypothetical protein